MTKRTLHGCTAIGFNTIQRSHLFSRDAKRSVSRDIFCSHDVRCSALTGCVRCEAKRAICLRKSEISRNQHRRRHIPASHPPARIGAALEIAGMGIGARGPNRGRNPRQSAAAPACDRFGLSTDSAASLISCSLRNVPVMLVSAGLLQQPFAGQLMHGHAMIGGVMADQFQLFQAVDFPGLVAEFAVIVFADGRVDLDDVLEDAAVVVHAGQHAARAWRRAASQNSRPGFCSNRL